MGKPETVKAASRAEGPGMEKMGTPKVTEINYFSNLARRKAKKIILYVSNIKIRVSQAF